MLLIETNNSIRHLRLNRPEKRNALSYELCQQLTAALDAADQDPAIHAILLTAEPPAFCAGMDLKEVGTIPDSEVSQIHDALFTIRTRLTTPLIAAVNGAAIAGGTGLIANAHIAIAHPDAKFGLPEIKIGLWPLLVFRAMTKAVGERRATEWSLTGRIIPPEEAKQSGLVTEIHQDPEHRAKQIAHQITTQRREAIEAGLIYAQSDQTAVQARNLRAALVSFYGPGPWPGNFGEAETAFTSPNAPTPPHSPQTPKNSKPLPLPPAETTP